MIPGNLLEQLCQSATQELCLVAPFIKFATLQRLLGNVSAQVKICCVTRWRPEEIAVGVSDLDIWMLLRQRDNSQLWLRPDLHAKYYRADTQCIIGSANITATALGWSVQPNLELLIDVPLQHPALIGFEEYMLAGCIAVDDELYHQTQDLVTILAREKNPLINPTDISSSVDVPSIQRDAWIPTLRNPEQLYIAYLGGLDKLTDDVYMSAIADVSALSVPKGLSKIAFEAYIGYVLLQMPIIKKVDMFVTQPRRFGEVSTYLKKYPCSKAPNFEAKFAWQTLMRWLLYFLPTRYKTWVDNWTEMFGIRQSA